MANHWYSEEMQLFHTNNRMSEYVVYHIHFNGNRDDYDPRDVRWGYIGVAPYAGAAQVKERYMIEMREIDSGARKRERKVISAIRHYKPFNLISVKLVAQSLPRDAAMTLEHALRPRGHTYYTDQRIWNEVAGG